MLDFANILSPTLMDYGEMKNGHFTDLQRPSYILRFSLGESHGYLGQEQSVLNGDALNAHEGRPYRFRRHYELLSQLDAYSRC